MTRTRVEINPVEFQNVIAELESTHQFTNRSQLWNAVLSTPWAKALQPQVKSAHTFMMRAEEFSLEIKTPKGRRGREKGCASPTRSGPRPPRVSLDIINQQKNIFDKSLHEAVEKAAAGSMKSAIKLKCIDCCAGSKKEVALCTISECPLWGFRPYKIKKRVSE